jgi:hypothetical protein
VIEKGGMGWARQKKNTVKVKWSMYDCVGVEWLLISYITLIMQYKV